MMANRQYILCRSYINNNNNQRYYQNKKLIIITSWEKAQTSYLSR